MITKYTARVAGIDDLHHIRSSIIVLAVRVGGIALQTVNLLVLSRLLSPEQFGSFATAFAFLAVIRVIGPLGFDQLALKGVFNLDPEARRQPVSLEDALGLLVIVNILFALTLALGALAFSAYAFRNALMIVAVALPAVAASGILSGYIRNRDYNALAQIPESIGLPAVLLLLVLIGSGLHQVTLAWCIGSLAFSAWLTFLVYGVIATRLAPLRARIFPLRALSLARECAAIAGALTLTAAASRLPIFLAAILLGPLGVATTEVALRFGTLGTIVTSSVATTFAPRFARAHARGAVEDARQLLFLSSAVAGGGACVVGLLLIIIYPFLTGSILPTFYAGAYPMLVLCAFGTLVNATFGLASNYLLMSGDARTVMLLSLFQLIMIAVIGSMLALIMGPVGIGVALVVGAVLRDGGSTIMARRMLRRMST